MLNISSGSQQLVCMIEMMIYVKH